MVVCSEVLARIARSISYSALPEAVVERAKVLILDSIGCIIGGTRLLPGRIMIRLFERLSGCEESTIVTGKTKVRSIHAATVNSYLANLIDLDDTYRYSHPGSTTVPPAIAVGEMAATSGQGLIEAVVAGYEVGIRVHDAIRASWERMKCVWGEYLADLLCCRSRWGAS